METILQNAELMEKLAGVESAEALAAVLAENNIALEADLTVEKFYEILKSGAADGELGEDDLADVSGGILVTTGVFAAGAAAFAIGVTGARFIAQRLKKR